MLAFITFKTNLFRICFETILFNNRFNLLGVLSQETYHQMQEHQHYRIRKKQLLLLLNHISLKEIKLNPFLHANIITQFLCYLQYFKTEHIIKMANNPFENMASIASNPIGQAMGRQALDGLKGYIPTDGYTGKIFTKELKSYFDIDTQTVTRKLIKLLFPFKQYEWDDSVKKLDLYIPTVSFMTLILFSTIISGIELQEGQVFDPKIGRKVVWIILLTILEIMLARCTENFISHLNIGIIELASLVSYRFVPMAVATLCLVLTNLSIPYLGLLIVVYVLLVDVYFCKLELTNYAKERFVQEGIGAKIGLCFHFLNTVILLKICSLI